MYDFENLKIVLFGDLDKFNVELSWYLLSKNKIVIELEEIF
jgi:hypothetical protein